MAREQSGPWKRDDRRRSTGHVHSHARRSTKLNCHNEAQKMKRFIAKLLLTALVSSLPLSAARAQRSTAPETLIRNATVLTVTHGTLQNTDVLLRNGKIAAIGKNPTRPQMHESSTRRASQSCPASSTLP